MKTTAILIAFILSLSAAITAQAAGNSIPLDKRVSLEMLQITEEYQAALQKCREHQRKSTRDSCIGRKKEHVRKNLEELRENPKAYFTAKDKSGQDATLLQNAGH